MSDLSGGPPTGPPILGKTDRHIFMHRACFLDTSQMKGGRMLRKKKSTPTKSSDLPPVEAKVECKIEDPEVFNEDVPVQPSTIQLLFDNANIDGSISDSPETLASLKKLWSEIGNTAEFDLETIKTVRIFNFQFGQNIMGTLHFPFFSELHPPRSPSQSYSVI